MGRIIHLTPEDSINPKKVKAAVYNRIDFDLPDDLWQRIDAAFAECWNNEIGLGGSVYDGQIENFIAHALKEQHIIYDFDKISKIVDIILDYLSMTGGLLD